MRWLSIAQVATRLGVSRRTVERLRSRGDIEAVNIALGSLKPLWRISEAEVERFCAQRGISPASEATESERNGDPEANPGVCQPGG